MFLSFINDSASINYDPAKYSCQRLTGVPIYSHYSGRPVYTDIVQGYVGSCWFLSCLASYLRPGAHLDVRQKDLMEMIDFYGENQTRRLYKVYLGNTAFIVDDWVPKEYLYKTPMCLWPILFEKAMLSLMGWYASTVNGAAGRRLVKFDTDARGNKCCREISNDLGEDNAAAVGLRQIMGCASTHRYLHDHDDEDQRHYDGHVNPQITSIEMFKLYRNGHHLLANTSKWSYPRRDFPERVNLNDFGAVQQHCYAILDIIYSPARKTYILTLYNPWGRRSIVDTDGQIHPIMCDDITCTTRTADHGIFTISWERFQQVFACVHHTV